METIPSSTLVVVGDEFGNALIYGIFSYIRNFIYYVVEVNVQILRKKNVCTDWALIKMQLFAALPPKQIDSSLPVMMGKQWFTTFCNSDFVLCVCCILIVI